jgi:phage gp29-like protein
MNPFKFLPKNLLPNIIRNAVRAYSPPAKGPGMRGPRGASPFGGMMADYIVPSVQARWLGASISWYTPQMVEYIYRQALAGDLQSQWEMFDMMESTWPELSKCENELKDSVCSLLGKRNPGKPYIDIRAFGGDNPTPEAQRRAQIVKEALFSMRPDPTRDENGLSETLRDIMDARFKGLAVLEVDWEPRNLSAGSALCPRATRWVHPSWYGYPFGPGNERLLLKLGGIRLDNEFDSSLDVGDSGPPWSVGGMAFNRFKPLPMGGNLPPVQSPMNFYGAGDFAEFPPNKFIVAVCKNKSGHPLGGAMLHILAWYWAAMNFSLEWFLNFSQLFGQPIRWANYDPNMDEADQAKLELLLQNMGSSAYGMFPDGVTMEMKEAVTQGENNPQLLLVELANKAARNLILRQTLTSDVGSEGSGSRALGQVHQDVLDDVKFGCGQWACGALDQLIRYICILNFGNDDQCPSARVCVPDEDESLKVSQAVSNLSQAGLEPDDDGLAALSKCVGFSLRRTPSATGALSARNTRRDDIFLGRPPRRTDAETLKSVALARAYRGTSAPVREIVLSSRNVRDCERKLARFYPDWTPQRVLHTAEEAFEICRMASPD